MSGGDNLPRWLNWVRASILVFACLSVGTILLTAARIYKQYHDGGKYDSLHGGMADFHNGAYYPALAIRDGISPYGNDFAEKYPVAKPTPSFSPSILALHIPLTYLPIRTADTIYFLFSVGIFLWIAYLATDESVPIGSTNESRLLRQLVYFFLLWMLLVSRGGHTTLLNGYFTPLLILGTQLAFQFSERRPWLAGFGILLASGKPTFAIPIGLLMLARGNYKSLSIGVVLSVIGGILPALWLASHMGWSELLASITDGQELHMSAPRELPINTWTRLDLAAIVAKWTDTNPSEFIQLFAMLFLIAIPCWSLFRLRQRGDREGTVSWSGTIAMLALIVTLYHHVYDGLVLVGPIGVCLAEILRRGFPLNPPLEPFLSKSAFLQNRPFASMSFRSLILLLVLLSTTWWNYFSSEIFLLRLPESPLFQRIVTSFNALSLVIALVLFVWLALRTKEPGSIAS